MANHERSTEQQAPLAKQALSARAHIRVALVWQLTKTAKFCQKCLPEKEQSRRELGDEVLTQQIGPKGGLP